MVFAKAPVWLSRQKRYAPSADVQHERKWGFAGDIATGHRVRIPPSRALMVRRFEGLRHHEWAQKT
jgi:hypothetical protein